MGPSAPQPQGQQVTFTSVPAPHQLAPLPQHTKMGEAGLAQLPHKPSSVLTVLTASTSTSVTVNFNSQPQGANRPSGLVCHVECQKRWHSTSHWYCYTPMLPATGCIKYKISGRTQPSCRTKEHL